MSMSASRRVWACFRKFEGVDLVEMVGAGQRIPVTLTVKNKKHVCRAIM